MSPTEHLERLTGAAAARGARALLVVETAPAPRPADMDPAPDRADRLAARLGTENPCLVHDARERLDPALLAAEAGTIPAGGALVLLVSPLEERSPRPRRSRFDTRFARLLLEHVRVETETSGRIALPASDPETLASTLFPTGAVRAPLAGAVSDTALAAQDAMLERALVHLRHGARPLIVIEAPRGRGKSALLGRLAAALEGADHPPAICAARRSATDVLERHRRQALPEGETALRFLAPDAALARGGDTLLVDEAASLPLPMLENLLERWRCLVLATTSAGYESAGRAFALRLPAILDRERPGWLRLTPPEPMRWRPGDPLDALLARATLADAVLAAPAAGGFAELSRLPSTRVDRDALVNDETRLASLYGLLAATHYQSSPLDLAHLLDEPPLALWAVEHAGRALGVALVALEPGIEPALHMDVLARRRRLPHRLLPQLLAQCANRGDALAASYARIVRIAVHPSSRRRGIASDLVDAVVRDTSSQVEAVGASFGETPVTAAFWQANGFTTFHRGYRRNPRSGQRSLAVLRASSARARVVLAVAAAIHDDNTSSDSTETTIATPRPLPPPSSASGASTRVADHDVALLRRFADGERGFSDTRAALYRLANAAAPDGRNGARAADPPGPRDERAAGYEATGWLLDSLGLGVPSSRRRREALLRDWVRERLDGTKL